MFYQVDELIMYITQAAYEQKDPEYGRRQREFFKGLEPHRINETIIERMLSL